MLNLQWKINQSKFFSTFHHLVTILKYFVTSLDFILLYAEASLWQTVNQYPILLIL